MMEGQDSKSLSGHISQLREWCHSESKEDWQVDRQALGKVQVIFGMQMMLNINMVNIQSNLVRWHGSR